MAKAGKSGVVEKSPNAQTVRFGGMFINLSAIARAQNLDVSYLSRIFSGQRMPALKYCIKIAAMLGMTLDQFVEAMEQRKKDLAEQTISVINCHTKRIAREDQQDLSAFARGRIPAPRLPATRKIS